MIQLQIQKVKIISDNICYGPQPLPEDEVEQHLIISATGRVWFTAYKYANGFGQYEICRKQQLTIGEHVTKEILELFLRYINSDQLICFATDVGSWEMTITDTESKTYNFKGSLIGGVTVGNIDLTDYLRKQIPIDNLLVFDNIFLDSDDED